ncbi:MAG: aminotransferase class IV [Synechococcus sp.]
MTTTIAWIDGRWGTPASLVLPLDDRGLLLADGLFETVLVRDSQPMLLDAHLQRWQAGADLLGLGAPPDRSMLSPLLTEAVRRSHSAEGDAVLRLNWSRGGAGRGIDPPANSEERFWLTLERFKPLFSAVTTVISRLEQRNASSTLSRCKSFAYGQAILARREARQRGADDALLRNSNGQLCCGTVANLLVRRNGTWLTPPVSSGCLPGVMRGCCLASGLAQESDLETDLKRGDQALLINSLSCRPIHSVDGIELSPIEETTAQQIWTHLLR